MGRNLNVLNWRYSSGVLVRPVALWSMHSVIKLNWSRGKMSNKNLFKLFPASYSISGWHAPQNTVWWFFFFFLQFAIKISLQVTLSLQVTFTSPATAVTVSFQVPQKEETLSVRNSTSLSEKKKVHVAKCRTIALSPSRPLSPSLALSRLSPCCVCLDIIWSQFS